MFSQTVELTHPNLLVNEILSPLNPLVIGRHGKENVWKSRLIKKKSEIFILLKILCPANYIHIRLILICSCILLPQQLKHCFMLTVISSCIKLFRYTFIFKIDKSGNVFWKKNVPKALKKNHTEKRWLMLVGRIIILFYLCTWVIIHYVLSIIIFFPLKMICRFLCNGETGRKLVKTWSKVMVY